MNNFWQRALTGIIFVSILVGAIVLGGWYMHITFGLIVCFGLIEFYKLFDKSESKPQNVIGVLLGTLLYFLIILGFNFGSFFTSIAIGLSLLSLLILISAELFRATKNPFENIALTYIGVVYIALPFLLINFLGLNFGNSVTYNFWPLLSVFILIWSNDTLAYLTGRLFGKHKLFERISPKKTWEGFFGGLVFAIIAGIFLAYFLDESYVKYICYALVVSAIGTTGDLAQSMLKRSVDVKDSGTILPGHGGILDRFDAVLFVIPVIFFLEKFIFVA